MQIERKSPIPLEIKATGGTTIAGYASVFGVRDDVGDIVMRGAFVRSLNEREQPLPMLWSHSASFPIGVWTRAYEDEKGLRVEGEITEGVQKADETLRLLRHGAIGGLSIGFRTVDAEIDEETGIRLLKEIDLWEVSVVTFPALSVARVDMKTTVDDLREMREREIEALLTMPGAGLSRTAARLLMRGGLSAVQAMPGAGGTDAVHRMAEAILTDLNSIRSKGND